jgi:thiol-disulfide isomerase/thioredoxin
MSATYPVVSAHFNALRAIAKHHWLYALFLLAGATQCHTQPDASIRGTIQFAAGWKPVVYLVAPRQFSEVASNYSGTILDSAQIRQDGSFAFSTAPAAEKAFLQLVVQQQNSRFANQLLDDNPLESNYMPVVWEPGKTIQIAADIRRFQATCMFQNPTPDNHLLALLRDVRHHTFEREKVWLQAEQHDSEQSLLDHEAALGRFQQPLIAFADSTTRFWPALVAARWVSVRGDYERVPEFMFRQCTRWSKNLPGNPWVTQWCQAASREKLPVMIGDTIPDYRMPMVTGDSAMLHQLLGKKLTVLDIWASWCAPCRRENRDVLAPMMAQYQEKGLQIVGYSIDSSPAAWKAAIAKDNAQWPHASHLSGDETPFLQQLRITTIPANFILDASGKVVAKNLHGAALEAFLKDFFQ